MVVPIRKSSEADEVAQGRETCHILSIARLGRPWTTLIQNLQGTPRVSILAYQQMVSILTAPIVVCILANQFLLCITICRPINV
jgi:hypothetical protein